MITAVSAGSYNTQQLFSLVTEMTRKMEIWRISLHNWSILQSIKLHYWHGDI